jgi:hypothetical protein
LLELLFEELLLVDLEGVKELLVDLELERKLFRE